MTTVSPNYNRSRAENRRSSVYSVLHYGGIGGRTSYEAKRYVDDEQSMLNASLTEASIHKSISHDDHRHHKFYKPTSNRTWVLVSFLIVLGLCILLLELAVATHPDSRTISKLASRDVSVDRRAILELTQREHETVSVTMAVTTSSSPYMRPRNTKPVPRATRRDIRHRTGKRKMFRERQDEAAATTPHATTPAEQATTTPIATSVTSETPPSSTTDITVGEPYRGDQLSNTEPTTDKPTTTKETENVTGQPVQSSQMTITSSDVPTSKITVGQPPPESQMSIQDPTSAAINGNTKRITSASALSTSGVPGTAVSSQPSTSGAAPVSGSASASKDNSVSSVASASGRTSEATSASAASVVSGSLIASGISIVGAVVPEDINTITATAGVAALTNADGSATATLSSTGNVVLTDARGKATKTVSYTQSSAAGSSSEAMSAAASAATSAVTPGNNIASMAGGKTEKFTQFTYFVAMYVPNMIGVVLQSAWLVVFATFKMMEPFYQLASPGGASAPATLTADHLSTGLSLSFAKAAFANHWVMVLAGQVQFALALIVLLVSESMSIVPTAYCKTEVSDRQPCSPKWVVNIPIVRAMEVFLVACFSMVLMILVLNRRRVSGVYSDPSRIATMADILIHKSLIQEIRDLPASATKSQIEIDLRDSRYMLGTFVANGKERYGIIKLDNEVSSFEKEPFYKSVFRRLGSWSLGLVDHITQALPFLADVICMLCCFILFMLITIYKILPGKDDSAYNRWMSSGEIGPNLLLSAFAVSIGFLVKRKERSLRLSHPYVLLSKGPQPASETITAGTRATQFSALWKGFVNGDISLALLSLAAILSDILLIIIPGIAFSNAQTRPVYLASTYTCMGLLVIIFLVQVRITFKEWQRGQIECPDTLAAVLMRLCASRFVEEKNNHEEWGKELGPELVAEFGEDDEHKQKERYEGVDGQRRYRFGCMEGVDGVQRYMVEEDAWPRRR